MKSALERIHPTNAKPAFDRLAQGTKVVILEYLDANPCVTLDSPRDVVNAYLEWNGIIGWTHYIVDIVLKSYDK